MITVVGSVNLDLIATVARLPIPGETVTDGTFVTAPGGKGANQALAAARAGAKVRMVAAVGKDAFADEAGRQAHLEGPIAAALMANAEALLASAPTIERYDVIGAKLPG